MKRRSLLKGLSMLPFLPKTAENFSEEEMLMDNEKINANPSFSTAESKVNRIKPKRLKTGDTLGLIAPASAVADDIIQRAVANLEGLGFKVRLGKNLSARNGYLAGSDQQRVDDLNWAFSDTEVDAVWCVRGGYGATRILPQVDFKMIRKNPKIFIGYSDITALHLSIYQKTGLVTFHGPVGNSDYSDFTKPYVWKLLTEPSDTLELKNSEENLAKDSNLFKLETLREGTARGKLVGGNLSLLSAMVGTPFALKSLKGKILFLEDIEERPYRVDRMLTQMLQSVDFTECAGIALGVFEGCNPNANESSLSLMECFKDRLGHLKVPIIYGLSFGHIRNQYTLPYGIEAELNTQKASITLLESAVL
jgi:muramoyltetrapeptide carboxypeptidase